MAKLKPDFYNEIDYWKKYLSFLPQKYQDSFTIPDETYWNWKEEKIHIDYKIKDSNRITAILLHGAGGNGRIFSLLGSYLSQHNINYYAPDNLGYGLTQISNTKFEYAHWVDMTADFTQHIIEKHKHPVILIGMSVGGMLAYQVASKVEEVSGIIATTLADPRDKDTMIAMAKNKFMGTVGLSLFKTFKLLLDNIKLPIKYVCKIKLMSRDPKFSSVFMQDKYGGAVYIPLRFLRTFASYKPSKAFEEFDTCPVLLVHPEKDEWTPFELSQKVFDRLKVDKEMHLLKECGHAPIEEPGIHQMEKYILGFIEKISK